MNNFDIAEQALETSLESAGSAMKEHEKWQQSLEAQINKLKASWQSLSQAFLSSDFLKGALDAIIALVDGLTNLIDTFGTLPTLIGMFAGFNLVKLIPSTAGMVGGIKKLSDILPVLQLAFSRVTAGVKAFASGIKTALTSLMGHPVILAVVVAVTALTAAFTHQKKEAEDLAREVEEVTSKYKEQHEELKKLKNDYDTSNESSMISKYEKLSKGVDGLGRNVSLTADEYAEYQNIVNSIAEQIPSLVSGYDEQGNALLYCKGNVEQLTEAYEKLIHAQNQQILSANAGDIEKNWKNTVKQATGYDFWEKLGNEFSPDGIFGGTMDDFDMKTDTAEWLSGLSSNTSQKEIEDYFDNNNLARKEMAQALQNAGYDVNGWSSNEKLSEVLDKALEDEPQKIQGVLDSYYAGFDEAVAEYKTKATALLSEAFDVSSAISGLNYGNIGEELQSVAYQTVNNLDFDFLSKLSESGKTIDQWTKEMLNQLNAISKTDNAEIEAAFDLQTKFNGGDISYGQYVRNLKDVEQTIDNLNLKSEAKNQLKISLGLDDEGVIDQYEALVKRLTDSKNYDFDISESEARKLLDGLSSEELSIAVGVITEMSDNNVNETIDQIRNAIDRELTLKGLSLDLSIEVETTKLEALSTAISESFSGAGLSSESLNAIEGMFGDLNGYDPSKLFERTANGITLNTTELRKLNSEYKDTNIAEVNKELDTLGDIYNQTRDELYRLTYGTDEYNAKAAELNGIEERIKATEQLAAQYKGLASAYQEWQLAESAGSQRDMYESIIEGFENIDDEISRGWYDDATIEFLELLSGKDLSTAGIEEVKKAYKGLGKEIEHTSYSVRDFFTVDDEGNSTNAGVYNFLDAIGQLEEEAFGGKDVVKRKDGKIVGFDFQIVGGDKVIADALGISEELVQIMVRAADDAGFVVSMDGTYQQLDILKEKAQEASVTLNGILEKNGKKGFDFNFNSTNVEDITKQLKNAKGILDDFRNSDGTINTKLEGADEALTVASTLQSMLDKLTRPTYMTIETSQVEDEIQESLQQLQELRRLTETEHQLKLSGADTSKLEESKNEVYEYFESLDPEIKTEIGLVDDKGNPLTGQALKDKLNSGDVSIEATVDIQMEMDEKLGVLVDKALLDAGIIDKKEFKKRVQIYLNADVDNKDAKEKTEKAVKEVAGSGGEKSSSSKSSKSGSSDSKIDKNLNIDINANINAADIKDETEKTIKDEIGEDLAIETKVELETTIDEATELIETLENADKDILIDVTIKGLDDVKELNKNIDLATKIKGDVDNLSKFVEGAKALSEIDDNITSYVTANIDGNVIETKDKKLNRLKTFAGSAKQLKELKEVGSFETDIDADVYAKIKGNVHEIKEKAIDNLSIFAKEARILKDADIGVDTMAIVDAEVRGNVIDKKEKALDNLSVFTAHAQNLKNAKLGIDTSAIVNAEIRGNVVDKKEKALDNLSVFAQEAKTLKEANIGIDTGAIVSAEIRGNVHKIKEKAIDNLSVFTEHAKTLKEAGIGVDTMAIVDAKLRGNIHKLKEKAIDNLSVFTEHAQNLKNAKLGIDTSAIVNAEIRGNIHELEEKEIDNLSKFAEHAKILKTNNIGIDTSAIVNAEIRGNVHKLDEEEINNLSVFAEHAKRLKDANIGVDTMAIVSAEIRGNAHKIKEKSIDNLSVFVTHAKKLKEANIGIDTSAVVNAKLNGNIHELEESKINNLSVFADKVDYLNSKKIPTNTTVSATATVDGNVIYDSGFYLDNLTTFTNNVEKLSGLDNVARKATAEISGNLTKDSVSDLERFKSVISGMSADQTVAITVTANVDSEKVNTAIALLQSVANSGVFKDYNATVQVGAKVATIDDTIVKNYQVPAKTGKVSYSVDELSPVYTWTAPNKEGVVNYSAEVEALTEGQKNKTGTITYTPKILSGLGFLSPAAGTAHANGTTGRAFARGSWGINGNGVALGGELGQELVVRDGRFFTIGDNGAEFFHYKKNDIVFNAAQTESLFKYGGIKGANPRGKMLASGSAFAEGRAFPYNNGAKGSGGAGSAGGNPITGQTYGSDKSSSSDSSKDFEEVIDWIEVIIDRVERAIDKFDQQANNIYKSWSDRNKSLLNQISEVDKEINIQQKAKDKYVAAANGVGLSESYASKVRNGTINIQTIKDENLKEKIDDYQNWYEKALDCDKAIEELKEQEAELYVQRVENVATQYESILSVIEHEKNILDEYISQSEANAQLVSANYYKALIDNENETLGTLEEQKQKMLSELQAGMESGYIVKGTEGWYELVNSIDEVTLSIAESQTQLVEYNQTLQQLSWETFDLLQDKISAVTEESEFLIELLSSDKLYDDKGQLTDSGMATMGLHGQNYNTSMYQADLVGEEIKRLEKEMVNDPYDTELEERYREMIALQQDYILSAQDSKEAIRDMVEEGINLELDALQELIDKKNEALDAERDLYEYQKKVKEQTEEIASLEKQMAAYSGDTSEEAQQKIQQIKVDLENAKADLQETEYDKMISDTQEMLDILYEQYEEILNTRLDNLDALVSDMTEQINVGASSISETLSAKADSVGYTLSDSMSTIWNNTATSTNDVITTYGEKFTSAQTTTNNALSTINTNLQNMITQLNKLAKTNVKSASISSAANSKQANATKKEETKKDTNKQTTTSNSTIKVGGKINAGSAKIYDYAGDKSGERQYYRNDPIYTVLDEKNGYLKVRYHKLKSGTTGWFKKSDVKAYATGRQNFIDDEIAWTQDGGQEFIVRPSDGAILTPIARGDSVLNTAASNNIWNMANSPAEFIKDNLSLGAASIPNSSNNQNSYVQNLDKVVFSFPNVKNYDEMLSAMQKDKNFERLVTSMSVDRLAGKSGLAKNKAIR